MLAAVFSHLLRTSLAPRLCAACALLVSLAAMAEDSAPPRADKVDATHDYVTQKFVGFVARVDRFFGDERNFQESNESVLQLDLSELMQRGGAREARFAGKAKLRLPATEERLHLLLESEPEKQAGGDETRQVQALDNLATFDNYGVAVRYEQQAERVWHFSSDIGLQLQTPVQPYARARVSMSAPLDGWRMKVAQSVFWFEQSGAGETTLFDFDLPLAEQALFRASSNVTWLHLPQRFDLRQDFSVYRALDERRALHYEASAIGSSRPQMRVDDYVLSLRYRQQLHRRWFFLEINPQLHFPHAKDFHLSPLLLLKLEVLFEKV